MNDTPAARVFFYEILPGDLRKLKAQSNEDPTQGGGARDIRFPDENFRRFMVKLFPTSAQSMKSTRARTSENQGPADSTSNKVPVTVRTGKIYWYEENELKTTTVEYFPPTLSRPSEGRLAQIHKLVPLKEMMPEVPDGRLFLLLVQTTDGRVFPEYLDEAAIMARASKSPIQGAIARCIAKSDAATSGTKRGTGRVMGYADFVPGSGRLTESYCHEH